MNTLLEQDKLWAEIHTSEEWARLPEEKHLDFLARINAKEIQAELSVLRALRKPTPGTPKEL